MKRAVGRGAFVATLIVAFASVMAHAQEDAEADGVEVIVHGEFLLSDARTPPPDDAPWKPVQLPDNWFLTHPGDTQVGWYRLYFTLPETSRRNSTIHLPRNSARRMDFYLNGLRQGGTTGYGDPGSRNWAPPLTSFLSRNALHPGRNVLHIRVVAVPEIRQGLTRVQIAHGRSGRPLYELRYATQVTTFFMFGAAALLCALLAAAFWLRERNDTTLLWFALTAFAWALAAFPWLHAAFTPREFFHGPLAFTLRFAYAVPMLVLCLRVAGKRWPLPEAALWGFTLVGLALTWLLSEERQGPVITYWSVTYLAALFALLVVLIRSQQGRRRGAFWLLAAALLFAVALNAHDFAWWMGWIDYDSYQLAHFHIPLVLFAIGATIIDRHFLAVSAVARAKVELEGRVAEKAREIEANYARIREAEHDRALAHERQRIMADMHDGLGSSLVSLLGSVQSGKPSREEIERRLLDALQELRLAVDALEPMDGDLGVVLGNVRHRMRAAIEDSGVKLRWQVGVLPHVSYLTPQAVLAVQKIVLEALTNALRHSQARVLTVSAQAEDGCLRIEVADDGVGFEEPGASRGRGLDNLRRRAAGLGGTLDIQSTRGAGASVILRLPLTSERYLAGVATGLPVSTT